MTTLRAKVVLLGDSGCGKTAISQVLHAGAGLFPKSYTMTFEPTMPDIPKSILVHEGAVSEDAGTGSGAVTVDLIVLDLPGQSFVSEHSAKACAGASIVVLVYDVCSRSSFEALSGWLDSVREHVRPDVLGVVIGNKADQGLRRAVPTEEGIEFGQAIGFRTFEVSAMDAAQVEQPFAHAAQAYYNKYRAFVASRGALA